MGLTDDEIWIVGLKKKPKNPKILICLNGQVKKLTDDEKKSVGMLMIDEAHRFTSESRIEALLSFTPKYIVAATATPDAKEDKMYRMVTSLVGNHSIIREKKDPFKFFVIDTGIDFDLVTEQPFTELCNLQAESEERNKVVIDIFKQNDVYSMIICHLIKMITNLSQECEKAKLGYSTLMKKDKDYDGSKKILIGSISKMGEGFDQSNFCSNFKEQSQLTILGLTFKNKARFIQALGRGTRHPDPYIVCLKDENGITERHIREMCKWVKDMNGTIYNIKYDKGMNLNLKEIAKEQDSK
jgi:ERCC4-related helicase